MCAVLPRPDHPGAGALRPLLYCGYPPVLYARGIRQPVRHGDRLHLRDHLRGLYHRTLQELPTGNFPVPVQLLHVPGECGAAARRAAACRAVHPPCDCARLVRYTGACGGRFDCRRGPFPDRRQPDWAAERFDSKHLRTDYEHHAGRPDLPGAIRTENSIGRGSDPACGHPAFVGGKTQGKPCGGILAGGQGNSI